MFRNYRILQMFVAASILMVGMHKPVSADMVYSDPNAYFNMAGPSSWALTGDYEGGFTPTKFELQNAGSNATTMVTMYSLQGTSPYLSVDDNKIMYNVDPSWTDIHTPYAWGMNLSATAAIDSFYLKVGALTDLDRTLPAHAGFSTHVTLVATDSYGIEWVIHQLLSEDMFFGIILEEGYFTNVNWYFSDGTDDVVLYYTPDLQAPYQTNYYGYWEYVEFGFGDGSHGSENATPEPGTLLLLGLGLTSLPFARRLRKK